MDYLLLGIGVGFGILIGFAIGLGMWCISQQYILDYQSKFLLPSIKNKLPSPKMKPPKGGTGETSR